jgi:haloacid dehalogenase superfamily, subfamily IA, variant 3 with third motif having DD or ED
MIIEGAIFDVDGTLLDTMPVWHDAGARFLATLGMEAEEGLGDKLFAETVQTGAEYLIKNYGLKMSRDEVAQGINEQMEKFYFDEAQMKPGAKELLNRMNNAGVHITVATSTDRYCIETAFERLKIKDCFDAILTCTEVGSTKDNPAIFFEATDIMGTAVPDTWVFEDGLYAIKTAWTEGFRTVGVYDEISAKDQDELRRYSYIYVNDLTEFNVI